MKKLLLFLALTLLLFGCSQKENFPTTPDEAATTALSELSKGRTFTRADADFIETNFGSENIEDAAVYFAEDGTELGFFSVDPSKKEALILTIRAYLSSEEESVRQLASLYPADDLDARLSRFKSAEVGSLGDTLVYYLLTDAESTRKITQSW